MAVTFTMTMNKTVSLDDHMKNTYGDQEYNVLGVKEYETTIYYTVESFYNAVFKTAVEYGGFDRDIPYVVAFVKAANGKFFKIAANMSMVNGRETCDYKIDAPVSYGSEYVAHLEYLRRKAVIEKKLNDRKALIQAAQEIGAPSYHVVRKLRNAAEQHQVYNEVIKLLKSFKKGTLRSEFRMSLAAQIFNWMNDPAPKFNSPLSPKQFGYLRPFKAY